MRRSILLVLASSFVLTVAAPAQAAKPTKTVYDSQSVNAFWYFEKQLSATTVERTTWYVGVYSSNDGVWSDLYVDSSTCTAGPRGETCTYDSKYGFSDLSDGVFEMDAAGLSSAHLEETYVLQSWTKDGEPADGVPTTIVADWTATGDLQVSGGKSTYCDDTFCSKTTWEDSYRQAEADGAVDGQDLGETYDANLSGSHSVTTDWQKK